MTGKAQSVPLVLLSITLKASGLKTRLSLGVCNILCYDIRGFMKMGSKKSLPGLFVNVHLGLY